MMTNKIFFALTAVCLCSCSHNLKFANNHFAVPVTSENQWGGHMSAAGTGIINVTVIDNISTNPPSRAKVSIDEHIDASDAFFLNNIGLSAALSPLKSLDIFYDASVFGLRWQFLNHDPGVDQWVASVQAGYGSRSQGTESNVDKADSDIKTKQVGASVGYRLENVVPYLAYVHEVHDVSTKVTNGSGAFGPYDDHGVHSSLALGVTSVHRGLQFTVELSGTSIKWDRAEEAGHGSFGGTIGYAW
jgi:hypothetical protein